MPFDEQAASEYQGLRAQRIRIGTMDLKIAAIALVHDALLLSANLRDFQQIPNLRVANWINGALLEFYPSIFGAKGMDFEHTMGHSRGLSRL